MTSEYFEGEDLETRVQQLEEKLAVLEGDSRLADLPYGTLKEAKSIFSVRSVGGALGGRYPAGAFPAGRPTGAGTDTAGRLYGMPFYLPNAPSSIIEIGLRVTVGGAGNVRLGLYADKGEPQLYPGKLLTDAGVVNTASSGVKTVTVRQSLPRGLVWVAALNQTTTPTFRKYSNTDPVWAALGYTDVGYPLTHYYVAQAYGALPDPFPASATEGQPVVIYLFLKFG